MAFSVWLAWNGYAADVKTNQETEKKISNVSMKENTVLQAGVFAAFEENIYQSGIIDPKLRVRYLTPEEQAESVYTFLQGPRAFSESLPWSGEWCQKVVRRNSFGGFGCGLCCMANIYSTLTGYECSPWDMYEYATQISNYYPTRESGAIGWEDMATTLTLAGFQCGLYRKPGTYEEFQEQMQQAKTMIVLVNSGDDDTFWKDTSGHYVNIWLYWKDTDQVFLAEPGDPEKNRTWIPLRYVYDALKTVSQYQYLMVDSYEEDANRWKWNGIDDIWNGK